MIGSFWNLCRACPSMPVDKLHSEYRSTYRWHEYTGPRQEVIRRPPQTNPASVAVAAAAGGEKAVDIQHPSKLQEEDVHNDLPKFEPAMPRRKKYPDLAYRHHEFLIGDGETAVMNGKCNNSGGDNRARSEERGPHWRPSRRSKSEGPRTTAHGDGIRKRERRRESDPDLENMGRETGLFRKAISKISTEYRLQFAWPQSSNRDNNIDSSAPRKSQSMGALKPPANAMVHKKRVDMENKDASELEPLVDDRNNVREDKTHIFKDEFNSEYKKKFRPFSQYEYSEGRFTNKCGNDDVDDLVPISFQTSHEKNNDSWYGEVVELRKKADEYKHRGWGSKVAPNTLSDICNKQVELWDQVSRRSSLSALSLASMTHKSYTKEEKDEDNNNKSSPSKAVQNAENAARIVKDMIRHHLERTTGGSELDGLILSPTREKLEPTIPKKDNDSRGSQKNSPKKNSPLKSSSLKRQSQKISKTGQKNIRSQSVGPTDSATDKQSPKRQSRSATVKERKSSTNNQASSKRPRPSSLNTTASSRSKHTTSKHEDRLAKSNSKSKTNDYSKQKLGIKHLEKGYIGASDQSKPEAEQEETTKTDGLEIINYEPVVKSPPEPTRVKSPEQILMRSPDPVNWTVPLDTGKTFTVTQNVKEGDLASRPHSEVKAWTPPDIPLPVAQSAPPSLTDQKIKEGMDLAVKV